MDVERAGGLECLQDGDGGGEAFSARAGHEQVSGGLVVVDDPDLDWGGGGFDEVASMTAVRTTEREGHLTMLLYLYDETAVSAQLILNTQLLPAGGPFAGLVNIQIPLLHSLPETPDVSVSEIQLGLGPETLTYTEQVAGKLVHYIPEGIALPKHCPRGGFPFAVTLGFLGGSQASARTAVPCPATAARRGRH